LLCEEEEKKGRLIMKKIIVVLAVLMVTSPAWAVINITCHPQPVEPNTATEPGSPINYNAVEIRYEIVAEANLPRAFAFTIEVDSGATIEGADNVDPNFYIHPGTFGLDEEGGVVGYVIAPPWYPESGGGEGSPVVATEQASLYIGESNAPGQTGSLMTLLVHSDINDCNLMIFPNVTRAGDNGVVMENPDEDVVVNYPGPCFLSAWCWCAADTSGAQGEPDGQASIHDLSALLNMLRTEEPYMSTPGYYGQCLGMPPPPPPE
jgi:hypothetical protein